MLRFIASVIVLISISSSALGQVKPTRPAAAPVKPPSANIQAEEDPLADFPDKGLPEPAAVGVTPTPALAAELARRVSQFDERSLSNLMTALQLSGFYIMDQNQKVLYMPRSGDGLDIAFYDFEVAGMLRASSMGVGTSIEKLGGMIATDLPEDKKAAFPQLMLTDLRNGVNSTNRHVKFASSFVLELSKAMPQPVDLRTASAASPINLIQASILERIFIIDLMTHYEKLGGGMAEFQRPRLLDDRPQFVNALWTPGRADLCSNITTLNDLVKVHRTTDKIADTVYLYQAVANGTKTIDEARKFPSGVSIANAVLAWMKLVAALMSVKARINVQEPLPLLRTKSSRNPGGEERTVTATFSIEFSNSKTINCVGKTINSLPGVKLNLSVPESGPLADRPVTWEVMERGEGPERVVNTPVYLSGDGSGPSSARQKTDANGESKVTLIGKPQKIDLTNKAAVPDPDEVELLVSVALEKMDAKKDLPKIGKFALGFLTDPFSIVEMIPEVISKMKLRAYKVKVPVQDWRPCSEDWGGLIHVKHEWEKPEIIASSRQINGNTTGNGMRIRKFVNEAWATLRPRLPEEMQTKPPNKAAVRLRGFYMDTSELTREADPCCGKTEGKFTTRVRRGSEMRYARTADLSVSVIFDGRERDYNLGFEIPTSTFDVQYHNFTQVDSTCPLDEAENEDHVLDSPFSLTFHLLPGRYGERVSNSAGDVLKGTKTLGSPAGNFTWDWELVRCKP